MLIRNILSSWQKDDSNYAQTVL